MEKGNATKAPVTYQDWLDCFDKLKVKGRDRAAIIKAMRSGGFNGSRQTLVMFQNKVIEVVNYLNDDSVRRFRRKANEGLAFNDFSQIELLFKRLAIDMKAALFFNELEFLPMDFRKELKGTVIEQMEGFWRKTVDSLEKQSLEHSNREFTDILFKIRRIKPFEH